MDETTIADFGHGVTVVHMTASGPGAPPAWPWSVRFRGSEVTRTPTAGEAGDCARGVVEMVTAT